MTVNPRRTTRVANTKVKVKLKLTDDGAKLDLTGQTKMEIWFRKPGSASPALKKAATNVSTANDTIIQYETEASFLDTIGPWRVEGYVEYGLAGVDGTFRSEVVEFTVEDNLDTAL